MENGEGMAIESELQLRRTTEPEKSDDERMDLLQVPSMSSHRGEGEKNMKYIITMSILVLIGMFSLHVIIPSLKESSERDHRRVQEVEKQQQDLIDRCFNTGGTPSIGYRAFGFPKTYLVRCDYPLK